MIEPYINQIHCGNNVEFCRTKIPTNSIDLTVTSPPYDDLRTYDMYSWSFYDLAHELYRITKPGGIVVWVVNDATVDGSETLSSMKQAIYFKEKVGFKLHDTMGYCKETPQPPSISQKRYASEYEYVFILSKNRGPKTFNPIMEKTKHGGTVGSTGFRQVDGSIRPTKMRKINDEKIKGNLWYYDTGYNQTTRDKFAFEHPAMFPEQLVADHIYSWSNEGDIIFDPFCGAGTTPKMATIMKRNFIGVDISEKYCAIARKRVEPHVRQFDLFAIDSYTHEEDQEDMFVAENS